jgi:ribosomal protein L2
MEKIKLSLAELLTLEAELNGYVNPQSGEQILSGFLKEKLNLATKYWLTKLSDKLTSKKKTIEVLRDELIKKFGEEKDGSIGIETFLDEEKTKVNPKFIEFQDEWAKLLSEEEEIEYNPLTVSDLEKIDSEGNYNLVFKLVKEDLAKDND